MSHRHAYLTQMEAACKPNAKMANETCCDKVRTATIAPSGPSLTIMNHDRIVNSQILTYTVEFQTDLASL